MTVLGGKDDKETLHFEFDLSGSNVQYIVGDSLGILPINFERDVNEIIKVKYDTIILKQFFIRNFIRTYYD